MSEWDLSGAEPIKTYLVPPFHKGNGQHGAEFTIYVGGGTPLRLDANDRLLIGNHELVVRESHIKSAPGMFDEFFPVKVIMLTNNYSIGFELNSYLKPLVQKMVTYQHVGMRISDPTSSIKIVTPY